MPEFSESEAKVGLSQLRSTIELEHPDNEAKRLLRIAIDALLYNSVRSASFSTDCAHATAYFEEGQPWSLRAEVSFVGAPIPTRRQS